MNLKELYTAEKFFLKEFPAGFNSENMKERMKKHKFPKVVDYAKEVLSEEALLKRKVAVTNISKFVSKTTMVSVFEKMRFRDFIKEIDDTTQFEFIDALQELIYGDEETGFNRLVSVLDFYKLAKWPLVTVYLAYLRPNHDIFIKPTTVKRILKYLEIDTIKYHSKPTYDFYKKYRDIINEIKMEVDESLRPNNAAFSGFLMMMLPEK